MPNIRLITFDLDNTLWAVDPVIIRAEGIMRAYLDSVTPEFSAQFNRDRMWQLRETVVTNNPHIRHDLSATREQVLRQALVVCGYNQQTANAHAAEAFRRFLQARHEVELFDGVEDTLATLSQQIPLAVVTNGNADVRRLSIGRYFSHHHSSASTRSSKPDAQIFYAALDDAGVSADEAVHVGDNWHDDIQGAAAVGMHTVWVNFDRQPAPDINQAKTFPASAIVHRLNDIPAALEELKNQS